MDTDAKQKITELVKDAKIGMLTTMTAEGSHQSRPMAMQDIAFEGDLWFFTYENTDKIGQVNANPAVNVSFSDKGANAWVSLSGNAEVVRDHQKAEELWSAPLKAWFPDGLDTDGLVLIKVHAESAEYWDSPNSTVIHLYGMAKAAMTGQPPKAGDNESVDFK